MHDQTDLEFIKTPAKWPLVMVLPVKRHKPEGGWPDLGVIFYQRPTTVYLSAIDSIMKLRWSEVQTSPKEEYASAEELVAAGWIVD